MHKENYNIKKIMYKTLKILNSNISIIELKKFYLKINLVIKLIIEY